MDDGGNVESETFYDSAGYKWKRSDERVATIMRKFSVDGNLVAESLCDENDKLMVGPQGWAIRRIAHQRSGAGYVVLRRCFGEDGKPVLIKDVRIAGEKKIFAFGLQIVDAVLGTEGVLGGLYALAVLLAGWAVFTRRLHDIGKSGWWWLIGLVPIVGTIFMLVFLCKDGQPVDNAYGANPKGM